METEREVLSKEEFSQKEIKVSISCLTYNHEKYIRKALDSIFEQRTTFAYEILIHDDASCDKTQEIIREYEQRYPQIIRPIYQKENQYQKGINNPSGVFNFPRARGKYIAMCEGDDYWIDPNKLQMQLDILEAHEEFGFVFHSAKIERMDGSFTEDLVRPYTSFRVISSKEILEKKSGYPTASLFFRTKYVEKLPEFYFDCPIGDIPLQIILASYGSAYYFDSPMSVYRIGDAGSWSRMQMSGAYIEKQKLYLQRMENTYKEFDLWTKRAFHKSVCNAVHRLRYQVAMNIRDWKVIFHPRNRRFFAEEREIIRKLTILEYRCPALYRILQSGYGLFGRIKRKLGI